MSFQNSVENDYERDTCTIRKMTTNALQIFILSCFISMNSHSLVYGWISVRGAVRQERFEKGILKILQTVYDDCTFLDISANSYLLAFKTTQISRGNAPRFVLPADPGSVTQSQEDLARSTISILGLSTGAAQVPRTGPITVARALAPHQMVTLRPTQSAAIFTNSLD